MNLIDSIVAYLNPDAGLRRQRARAMLSARAHEGANKNDGWKPRRPGASANTDVAADADELCTRARALVQNVPYIARGLAGRTAYAIGTGIVPVFLDAANGKRLQALFDRWVDECDADGRENLWGLQRIGYETARRDGDAFIRKRWRRPEDGLAVPLQLQLLERDWLDRSKTQNIGGNTVVNGIEYDMLGRVVAYWMYTQHPGDMLISRRARLESRRISADQIIHYYNPSRPGQGSGISSLAPIIARARDLQLYEDAELHRKNLETRFGVVASGDVNALRDGADNADASGERPNVDFLGELPSGGILQVPDALNLTSIEPKAAPGYADYVKHALHIILTGMGSTYELGTGDVSEVNFSSARIRRLDFQRDIETELWTEFVPKFCRPIVHGFFDGAELSRALGGARIDRALDWSAPKWDYVNPEQEVSADTAEIAAGLSSISEKLRRRGYKPALVFNELSDDINKLRELGLLDTLLALQRATPATQANTTAKAAT